jgi:uncharacterized protein (TIGR00255 family)
LRAVLKSTVRRGHVDLRVLWEPAAGQSTIRFNAGLLDAYMAAFRQAAASYGLNGGPDLNSALRIPGMLQAAPVNEMAPRLEEDLAAGLELALAAWNAFREREGEQLRREMLAHHENLAALGARMTGLREELVSALRARLDQRLGELQARVDPSRLAQEAALLVERSDVAEEIARFNTHAGQLGELLAGGGEIGKKLDFLLQEIGRETNTFLAKSANAGAAAMILSDLALTAKSAVEKIREQSLNVE